MLFLLPVAMFISVGWFAHEPITLLSSSVLILWLLAAVVFTKEFDWKQSKLFLAPLLIPVGYLISAVINSQSPASMLLGAYQRNYGFATMLALGLLFVLVTNIDNGVKKFIDFGFQIVLIIANIYGYLQYFDLDPIFIDRSGKPLELVFGNANFAGALFGILAVIAFAKAIYTKVTKVRVSYLFLFGSTIFLGLQTKSIQTPSLLILSVLVFSFISSLYKSSKTFKLLRYSSVVIFSFITIAIISIFSSSRNLQIRDKLIIEGNILQRFDYWRTGLNIWQDNFVFGVGADQFQRYAALYRTPEQIMRDGNMLIPDKAHNVFIDHLANGGLIVGSLWLTMVLSVFYVLFKIIRSSFENHVEISILASIWTAYVVQSLISPDQILLSAIGYSSAGLIVGTYLKQRNLISGRTKLKKNPFLIRATFACALFIALVIYTMALGANKDAKDMLESKLVGADAYILVLESWPNPKVTELLGINIVKNYNNCVLGNTIANKLIKIDDRSAQGWFLKALCANTSREFITAISYVDNSLKFDPFNPFYLISKAKLEIAANQLDNAASTVAKVKSIKPTESEIAALELSITVSRKKTE